MKKVLCHALTLSLMGLVFCGEYAAVTPVAYARQQAAPVSGTRSLSVSRSAMPVGTGGTLRLEIRSGTKRRRRSTHRSHYSSRSAYVKRTVASGKKADAKISTNLVTGIAVIPEESTVRLVIESSEPFNPEITTSKTGSTPATIIRVPGALSDEHGVGSVAVHKNGVFTVRYANQQSGLVQLVANTQENLEATSTPSADRRHWEIELRRPAAEPTQIAMDTTGSHPVPILTGKRVSPVVFKPVGAKSESSEAKTVKPVVIQLPGSTVRTGKSESTQRANSSVAAKPVPAFIPSRSVSLTVPPMVTPSLVGQTPIVGTGEDKRISLDVVGMDINDVIKALALQSGINVVTSTEVKGVITVSLKRIPMIEALDTITRLSGYQYARLNSGYIVGSPASVAALTAVARETPKVTEYVRYRYVSPSDLYTALRNKFPGLQLPPAGATDSNPAQSKILVLNDTHDRIVQVRAFVDELEKQAAEQTETQVTELYKIKAANATDLIRLVQQLAPTVFIQVGPSQAFQASGTGQSAAFAPGGTLGAQPSSSGGNGGDSNSSNSNQSSGNNGTPQANSTALNSPTTLVLTGSVASIQHAREILERIDVRTPQIAYEARVVDVNREDLQTLGLRYDFTRQAIVGERNETGQGTVGSPAASQAASNPNFSAIYRSPYTIGVTLDALANKNRARTLASPNLSAIDGQPATAFIGDQIKYVIAVQQTQQGQTIQTETATVGITLKVTGKASPDGYITLYIHPEVSTITSFRDLTNGISLPQISTRYVDTTVRVKSGETIAIGGLLREQDVNNLQKVPIIGDLPFFGQLFRRSQKTKSRSEIVVFVTAKATEDGG